MLVGEPVTGPRVATHGGFHFVKRMGAGMSKVAILIDGGYLRKIAQKAKYSYNPDFVERVGLSIAHENENFSGYSTMTVILTIKR